MNRTPTTPLAAADLDYHHVHSFNTLVPSDGRIMAEYIWTGGSGSLDIRSKTRVLSRAPRNNTAEDIPVWNYDGSSTCQADTENSEVIIKPCAWFRDPLRGAEHILVICDTYRFNPKTLTLEPIESNTRAKAKAIFDKCLEEHPWFGMEQEYVIYERDKKSPFGWPQDGSKLEQGAFYCGVGCENQLGRALVEAHLKCCLNAGITISGINAEVMPSQFEFQVGPVEGVAIGDHMLAARFLLLRLAEVFGVTVSFDPKPVEGYNGSGLHTNFSTEAMRIDGGLDAIVAAIEKLSKVHAEHMALYGEGNERRLVGHFETSSFDKFSWGYGSRKASIRVGWDTFAAKKGYMEDRRPSSNGDPYLICSKLVETCCLGKACGCGKAAAAADNNGCAACSSSK